MDLSEAPSLSLSEHFCRRKIVGWWLNWTLNCATTDSNCLWDWGLWDQSLAEQTAGK